MEKGMTFEDYEYDVKLWMASGLVAKEKQALLLINEFPSKDERMLKKTVADAIGFENLAKADGAQRVLDELGKILKSPTFVRLASWLEGFESIKQGSGTFDKFMTRLRSMKKMAKDEFNFELPPMIMVAKMLQGCSQVTPENIGIITQGIKLESEGQDNLEAKIEASIKQFVTTVGVFTKDQKSQAFFTQTDLLGNPIIESPQKASTSTGFVNDPTQDKEYQAFLAAKKQRASYSQARKENDRRRERCRKEGRCYEEGCESTEHKFYECPRRDARLKRKATNAAAGQVRSAEVSFDQPPSKKPTRPPSKAFFMQSINGENIQMNATKEDLCFTDDEDDSEPPHMNRIFVSKDSSFQVDENMFGVAWSSELKDQAIIDSGCSRSVCGVSWFQAFKRTLNDNDCKAISMVPSEAKFKFGGHGIYTSKALITAPVYVGGKRIFIRFDMVETDIPLLISLKVMKRLEMNIQYSKDGQDLASVRGATFKLRLMDGHHWINLSQSGSQANVVSVSPSSGKDDILNVYLSEPKVFDVGKEVEQLRKIHVNRAHMPRHKMEKLLKTAGQWNSNIREKLDEMINACDIKSCRFGVFDAPYPKAAFRMPREVGDIVAVDLKIRSGKKDILFVIDLCTSYAKAILIDNKTAEEVADKFFKTWYATGLPTVKQLVSDNGQEFCGAAFQEMMKATGTSHVHTVPWHPEMNGANERIHHLIMMNMEKIQEDDPRISDSKALVWACHAYNACEMRSGFSPYHLLFGSSDNITAVQDLNLLECEDWNDNYRKSVPSVTPK